MIGKCMRIAGLIFAAVAGSLSASVVAEADEVSFPKDKPLVVMDVPPGWTVEMDAPTLVLKSPEKNSMVLAQVIGRDKAGVEAWTKAAAEKLKAFGVAFSATDRSIPTSPPPQAPPSSSATDASKPGVAASSAFTFSGPPSLALPGADTPPGFAMTGAAPLPAPGDGARLKVRAAVEYGGTTVNGKPVDTELVLFDLPDHRLFVFMQESNPEDNRSVAIGKSVRNAK
jgi:hypothetical protein